ncbi:MAG TPA: hypothetical protein VK797_08010 [Tepidisphaeraceae bacterium]|nr:hypothetical protein [Tepidisphaeraceae bacterium]
MTQPKQSMGTAFAIVLVSLTPVFAQPAPATQPSRYFAIQVVDEQTGRGVPLVELKTVSAQTARASLRSMILHISASQCSSASRVTATNTRPTGWEFAARD